MPINLPLQRLVAAMSAVAIVCGILFVRGVGFSEPWDKAVHFTVWSALTLSIWRATEMPFLAIAAAVIFGGIDEWRQAYIPGRVSDAKDFIADACAVLATATLLFMHHRKAPVCAESSPQ